MAQQGGNDVKGLKDFYPRNGSSHGQDLASTVLFVPNSLNRGLSECRCKGY